ncbi:hypothetical protein IWX92DRAFT_432713, partial [Phyllosticta citricarpa]
RTPSIPPAFLPFLLPRHDSSNPKRRHHQHHGRRTEGEKKKKREKKGMRSRSLHESRSTVGFASVALQVSVRQAGRGLFLGPPGTFTSSRMSIPAEANSDDSTGDGRRATLCRRRLGCPWVDCGRRLINGGGQVKWKGNHQQRQARNGCMLRCQPTQSQTCGAAPGRQEAGRRQTWRQQAARASRWH